MNAIDPHGATRAAEIISRTCSSSSLTLRLACERDAELVWPWRNHESTRTNSFDPKPISLANHTTRWSKSIANDKRILIIVHDGKNEAGVLRFDLDLRSAVASVYLNPDFRGKGLAADILRNGSDWLFENYTTVSSLYAEIKPDNIASLRAFESAGYFPFRSVYKLDR